jgi:myo-inositol-1(or 4)-monophosphatase
MLDISKKASILAGDFLLDRFDKIHDYQKKGKPGDFSTEADKEAEKIIISTLQEQFPKHNFISEECGKINNDSEYTWIIDPLDGTFPYTARLPFFGVSIGLVKNNIPILGVINLPKLKINLYAETGKGAFSNGEKIKVSSKKQLNESILSFDWGYLDEREVRIEKFLKPLSNKTRYLECFGCSIVAQAYVALGIIDGYFHRAHPWDFAAGVCIIKEAGGKVTDWEGEKIDLFQERPTMIASNGLIHSKILNLIK